MFNTNTQSKKVTLLIKRNTHTPTLFTYKYIKLSLLLKVFSHDVKILHPNHEIYTLTVYFDICDNKTTLLIIYKMRYWSKIGDFGSRKTSYYHKKLAL